MKKSEIDPIVLAMGCTEQLMPDSKYVVSDEEIIGRINKLNNIQEKDVEGRNLLMYSAIYERHAIVQMLLQLGFDVNIKDRNKFTALHFAVQSGNINIVEALIKAGSDVNAKDKFGNSPILKCNMSSASIIELLLKSGADPLQENNYGISAVQLFSAQETIIKIIDTYSKN